MRRDEVDLDALTAAQETAGLLPHAMSAYIAGLAPQMDTLPEKLRAAFNAARAKFTNGVDHLRVPETVAHLWVGFDCGLQCATELGAISAADADQLRADAWTALLDLAIAQAHRVEGERPTRRFLEVLAGLLDQNRVVLVAKPGRPEDLGEQDKRQFLGWSDGPFVYLLPDAVFGVVSRACRDAGEPFPVRQAALAAALDREGHTECASERHSKVERLGGKHRRVWKLRRASLDAVASPHDECEDDDVPDVTGSIR